jgi:hypothetical protein
VVLASHFVFTFGIWESQGVRLLYKWPPGIVQICLSITQSTHHQKLHSSCSSISYISYILSLVGFILSNHILIMYFSNALFGLAALTAVNAASQWTVQVLVGPDGLLEFLPNDIVAPVGSQIEFLFNPKVLNTEYVGNTLQLTGSQNHTVTQSNFANPCHPLDGGFFSGFQPTTANPSPTTFTITVNNSQPIWFYCSQTVGSHCQKGMVGAINAPTSGNTLEKFIALAAKANTSTAPAEPAGGIFRNNVVLSANSSTVTAAATVYSVSTYTTNGQAATTTLSTSTLLETALLAAVAVTGAPSSASSSVSSTSTSHAGAAEKTAHLLGAAVVGLGALALL